jgi:hypothetical protein
MWAGHGLSWPWVGRSCAGLRRASRCLCKAWSGQDMTNVATTVLAMVCAGMGRARHMLGCPWATGGASCCVGWSWCGLVTVCGRYGWAGYGLDMWWARQSIRWAEHGMRLVLHGNKRWRFCPCPYQAIGWAGYGLGWHGLAGLGLVWPRSGLDTFWVVRGLAGHDLE